MSQSSNARDAHSMVQRGEGASKLTVTRLSDEESYKCAKLRFQHYFEQLDNLGDLVATFKDAESGHKQVELSKVGAKPLSGVRGIYFSKGCWKTKYIDNDGNVQVCVMPYDDEKSLVAGFDVAFALVDKIVSYGRQVNTKDGCIIDEPTRPKLIALDNRKKGRLGTLHLTRGDEEYKSRRTRRYSNGGNCNVNYGYGGALLNAFDGTSNGHGHGDYYYYENDHGQSKKEVRGAQEGGKYPPQALNGVSRKRSPGAKVQQRQQQEEDDDDESCVADSLQDYNELDDTSESPSEIDDEDDEDYNHNVRKRSAKRKKASRKCSSSKRPQGAHCNIYSPSEFERRFQMYDNVNTKTLLEHVIDNGSLTCSKLPFMLESSSGLYSRASFGMGGDFGVYGHCMYPWYPGSVGYSYSGIGIGGGGSYYSVPYCTFPNVGGKDCYGNCAIVYRGSHCAPAPASAPGVGVGVGVLGNACTTGFTTPQTRTSRLPPQLPKTSDSPTRTKIGNDANALTTATTLDGDLVDITSDYQATIGKGEIEVAKDLHATPTRLQSQVELAKMYKYDHCFNTTTSRNAS